MSERNKSALEQANQAISQGDFEGFLVHCTEDTTWHFVGDRTLQGKQAVRQWMRDTYQVPPRFHVDRILAEADTVAAMGRITLQDASGRDTHHAYCDVWAFRDGKMCELTAYVVDLDPPAG